MSSFDLLNQKLQKLAKSRFGEPTNIQDLAIPEIMKGGNVLVIAGTGFGKTESVMLPVLNALDGNNKPKIAVLYVTPLRSLNRDMMDRLFWWADKLDLEISVRHGDTLQKERAEHRESPPDIMIITPESLQAVLPGKVMRKHLANVKCVVIDEIHELVSSERGTQLSLALERLRRISNFQTIGISATVGSEERVAEFIGGAKIIKSEVEKEMEVSIQLPEPKPEDSKLEDKLFVESSCIARLREIMENIKTHKSTLIFTNTRQTAEVLSSRLRILDKAICQDVHHGSLSKEVRVKNEGLFKNQNLKALVATSSLELGIDIGSVDLVIQYLSPRQVTKMIQRIGRSGHRKGEKSVGILLTDKDDVFESAVINKNFSKRMLEKTKIHENALDVLAHQIIGLALDEYGIQTKEIYDTIKKSYCFRNITKKEFDSVLDFMASIRFIFVDQKTGEVRRSRRGWQYYFENLSTIPDTKQYMVTDMASGEPIGSLDETFVAEHCHPGSSFICKGRGWKVVETEKNKVLVESSDQVESAIPSWEGELIPVPAEVATGVGQLRRIITRGDFDNSSIRKEYGIDSNSLSEMKRIMESQKKFFIPDEKSISIETCQDFIIIHSCAGSLVNDAIGRFISSMLNIRHGVSVQMKTNPYSIIIKTVGKPGEIEEILKDSESAERLIMDSLENSSLFKWRFAQASKRFGIIERGAYFEKINLSKLITFYKRSPIYDETMREILLEKTDVSGALSLLEKIRKRDVKISVFSGTSPIGKQNLLYQFGELITPKEPTEEIFKLFKRRLMNTQVTLLCMNCGKYHLTQRVAEVYEQPECTECGSRLIGILNRGADFATKLTKKKISGKSLTKEEQTEFDRIRRTADLIIVYGSKAVLILAARGVGAEIASRILSKLQPNEEQFLKDIFEAEKNFARTHKYWK